MVKVENALREMILEVVKEARPELETTLTASPKYLNVAGAAEYLGVSRTTFFKLRESYPLKQYDFDGAVRFKPSDLDAWAEQFKED